MLTGMTVATVSDRMLLTELVEMIIEEGRVAVLVATAVDAWPIACVTDVGSEADMLLDDGRTEAADKEDRTEVGKVADTVEGVGTP